MKTFPTKTYHILTHKILAFVVIEKKNPANVALELHSKCYFRNTFTS